MRRWHLMLEKLHSNETDAKLPIDYLDVVYAFFQSCYHLKDWVLMLRTEIINLLIFRANAT